MKFMPLVLTTAVSLACLTACNKTEKPQAEEKPTTTQTAPSEASAPAQTSAPATTPDQPAQTSAPAGGSPTVAMYVDTMKVTTFMQLMATNQLTDEQKTCLMSNDANATYLDTAKTELGKTLGEDGLKASDEFYASELGQKVAKFARQELHKAIGQPVEGEPVTLTDEDKTKMMEFSQSDIGKKIDANTKNIDPQAMMKQLEGFAASEKTRCKIG